MGVEGFEVLQLNMVDFRSARDDYAVHWGQRPYIEWGKTLNEFMFSAANLIHRKSEDRLWVDSAGEYDV